MLEELLYKLLEQTPVIIVLGVGIYHFVKKIDQKEKEAIAERKAHKKELRELVDRHAADTKEMVEKHGQEIKALNEKVWSDYKDNFQKFETLLDAIENISDE